MPGFDGTGPRGFGSMTGRGLGYCAGGPRPSYGWGGYGVGRGGIPWGGGRGRAWGGGRGRGWWGRGRGGIGPGWGGRGYGSGYGYVPGRRAYPYGNPYGNPYGYPYSPVYPVPPY